MPITIRQADLTNPADLDQIVAMLDVYARDPMGMSAPLPDTVRHRLPDLLRTHPTARAFLAMDGDAPCGLAMCFLTLSTFSAAPVLNIHDFMVAPTHQRRGVGRQLMAHVIDAAGAMGCCKVSLEVRDDNHPARALYQKFGFGSEAGTPAEQRFWFRAASQESS